MPKLVMVFEVRRNRLSLCNVHCLNCVQSIVKTFSILNVPLLPLLSFHSHACVGMSWNAERPKTYYYCTLNTLLHGFITGGC